MILVFQSRHEGYTRVSPWQMSAVRARLPPKVFFLLVFKVCSYVFFLSLLLSTGRRGLLFTIEGRRIFFTKKFKKVFSYGLFINTISTMIFFI